MSRPRFLADHDFNFHIVSAVRRFDPAIEIATLGEEGRSRASDAEVLELAHATGRLLLSHDVNTLRAEAERRVADGRGVSGVFLAAQRTPVGIVADAITLIWAVSEAEEWIDRVEFIPF
jgi:hypothetical protein